MVAGVETHPKATRETRQKARSETFAVSNIMFHPLFELAKNFWLSYDAQKKDWTKATEWKTAIAKIAGKVALDGEKKGAGSIEVMSRKNPAWVGRIVIQQYGPSGVEEPPPSVP
jgi:hypothetical protein